MLLPGCDVFICDCACRVRRIGRFTGICGHSNPASSTASSATPAASVDHKRECDATHRDNRIKHYWRRPSHIHHCWKQFHSRRDGDHPPTRPGHFVLFRHTRRRAQCGRRHRSHNFRTPRDGFQHRDRHGPESKQHPITRRLGDHTVPAATQSAQCHV
jgi:hypothetical protein